MLVSIILINYKALDHTLECLESLEKIQKKNFSIKILVVDNNSQDNSADTLKKIKEITLIQNKKNLGFSGGNNVAIKKASEFNSDFILILNNDTLLHPDFLISLITADCDIVSPKIYFAPGFEFHKKRYKESQIGKIIWYAGGKIDWQNILGMHIGVDEVDTGQFSKPHETDFATGACMLIKRKVFEKIGFFDEKYFLYLEDMDLCFRAAQANFEVYFEPRAIIWHKNAASAGGSGSKLQDYYITRNRLLFAFKFAKPRTKIALLKHVASKVNDPIKRKAFIDFITGKFGKSSINFE